MASILEELSKLELDAEAQLEAVPLQLYGGARASSSSPDAAEKRQTSRWRVLAVEAMEATQSVVNLI